MSERTQRTAVGRGLWGRRGPGHAPSSLLPPPITTGGQHRCSGRPGVSAISAGTQEGSPRENHLAMWVLWGFGCSLALSGPWAVLGRTLGHSPGGGLGQAGRGTSSRLSLALSHLCPEPIPSDAACSRRGRGSACPRAPGPWEQLSVALARRLVGRRSPASCYSRTRRTGQQEPKNSLARRASQAPGPASRGPGSPVAATSGPASCGQRHRPARHGHPCPAASLACRPAVPGPSSLPQLCLVEPHLLLRLGLCHASRDPLRPGDAPSSSPPRLTSRPPESPQHLGCPYSGALGCWS